MTASQMNTSEKINATMVCQVYNCTYESELYISAESGGKPFECPCFSFNVAGLFKD